MTVTAQNNFRYSSYLKKFFKVIKSRDKIDWTCITHRNMTMRIQF